MPQNSPMNDEERQMYVFANNPEGHQLLHTFKQLLRDRGEDEGLIAIVKGVQSRDQQIVLEARIDEADYNWQQGEKFHADTEHFGDRDHAFKCLTAGQLGRKHRWERELATLNQPQGNTLNEGEKE